MERRLAHPPERVWPALTEPGRLATWFPSGATIEPRVGGKVVFGFGGDGVVTDLDPPRLIAFTWEADHLRFELRPDGDGSVLLLVHSFDDRAGAASFAAGWDTCFAVLDGTDPLDHRVLHERYVEELGLSEPTVAGTAEAWEVHVERQLVHPADEVRAVLDGEPWELLDGTGHGARVRLVRTGSGAAERDRAVRELPEAVTALVDRLAGAR
ncbi:SRPBCC domain-containing protein [Pseudonocardia sp. KRD-169]|uniref:SRPBCC domain-containing protein n=2 Tax=Pseudonocardia abyssalis TaxID=2792008 RepID=A0ABS6UWD1_9PSEU|nr:SRPBCC domain-containing protein [Pseudonocardia abyssalis]MBW0136004.1 SRPBCC domain-containing protein [Pseudonocardia abyssalis]